MPVPEVPTQTSEMALPVLYAPFSACLLLRHFYHSKNSQKSNANFVMGYALNLCKFHIYNVPYNHNIAEEGMKKDIFL